MTTVAQHLLLLESLKFADVYSEEPPITNAAQTNDKRLKENLIILKQFIQINEQTLAMQLGLELKVDVPLIEEGVTACSYCIYLEHVLLQLLNDINFNSYAKEDLIATRHLNLFIKAIQDLAFYALHQQLHPVLRIKGGAFASVESFNAPTQRTTPHLSHLQKSIALFSKILHVKQFHIANSMECVLRDFIAAIFTLFISHATLEYPLGDATLLQLQQYLNCIWLDVSKIAYFRNIFYLKTITALPAEVQRRLHQELLFKLLSKDGFTALVATLVTAAQKSRQGDNDNCKQTYEVIANIAAHKGHSKRRQELMLKQVFKFIDLCTRNEPMMDSMGAGLLTLRRLYNLNVENQALVKTWLKALLQPVTQPEDLLSGLVLMDHEHFCLLISQVFHIFCTSSVECLPSELLIAYLPLLLQMYHALPTPFMQKKQISQLIIRCLANRAPDEQHAILGRLYKRDFAEDWVQLHERILIYPNAELTQINLKIVSSDVKQEFNISVALPELLLASEHNILTYQVFMSLLHHMDDFLLEEIVMPSAPAIDLLQTADELVAFLNTKYPVKVDIILSLNSLVSHGGLKCQLAENCADFLHFLRQLIEKRINATCNHAQESADQTLLIMLTLTQEILEYTQRPDQLLDFTPTLQLLRERTPNQLIKQRIDSLVGLIEGNFKKNSTDSQASSAPFSVARSLIESNESHLQVYGMQLLLDLLRRHDAVTVSNAHVIIALALTTLKNKESYTFLNCVRLFVGMVDIMEAEVLEVLSDEYLNEHASMDLRLVVGEAILKVSKELGPFSYKYKDVLLNCFMQGARSHIDEFRWSSFSNLSHLCRTLSYQVHNFFNELISLIDCELTTSKYLPAKRAAVLVVSELLEGMENLMDFEEMLLPLYRILKAIEANINCDEKMRLHASNGLKAMAEKCNKFLFPKQAIQKEIQIFGIKDNPKQNSKTHILEIN